MNLSGHGACTPRGMPTMRPTFLAAAALLGASLLAPSVADAGPRQAAPRSQIVQVERAAGGTTPARKAPARAAVTGTDVDRYAARDAKAKDQKQYEGGSYVVIGLSGTAIVVIILILILL